MTRFKELPRIEQGFEHGNEVELCWELDYCQMRCKVAKKVYSMRKQAEYWTQMERKVRAVMENLN
jgi:hypothetical protein